MKKVFITLLLLVSVSASAQQYVNRILMPYVQDYIGAMSEDGWDIMESFKGDYVIAFDDEVQSLLDMDKPYDLGTDILGIANGMNHDNYIFVVINRATWSMLTRYEQADLVNHELMHDVYNFEHQDESKESHLMHPTSMADSDEDAEDRLNRAIYHLNVMSGYNN